MQNIENFHEHAANDYQLKMLWLWNLKHVKLWQTLARLNNHFQFIDPRYHDYVNQIFNNLNCIIGKHIHWTKINRPCSLAFWVFNNVIKKIIIPNLRTQLRIPYLFSLNCRKIVSSPSSEFLGRSSTVYNVRPPKVLYKASLFRNSRSDWSHLLIPFESWIWNCK